MTTDVHDDNFPKIWEKIIKQARQSLVDTGYPIPVKPKINIQALQLPDDVEGMDGLKLANLLMRLQAWYAYSTAQLAFSRAEVSAFEQYYEVELGAQMHFIAGDTDTRMTKDVLKAVAVKHGPMELMFQQKVTLGQRTQLIEGMVKSLDIQVRALTTEQIRRHSAQKLMENSSPSQF